MADCVDIYIRLLRVEDALISWRWRNNPEIWKYTGSRPDREITREIETEWIIKAIADKTSRRFAICVVGSDKYIGNVQLTNIDMNKLSAEFHIFIGETFFWGKGVATLAMRQIIEYARSLLGLREIRLSVNRENLAAVRIYHNAGFVFTPDSQTEMKKKL
jgi:RimJ/RimL family protein N-acetyltransferase